MNRSFYAAFVFAALTLAVAAHADTYKIETDHTRAEFRVSHLGFSEMPGMFNDIKGKVEFSPDKPDSATVEAVINTNSITMNHAVLDKKLKGPDFFNTEKYPTMTFKSTEVDRSGSGTGTVKGNLTLLGVTKPVTLKVKFNKKAWNKYMGAEEVGFTAWAKIHRSDFGMKYILPDVGDDVLIRLDVEALKAKPGEMDEAAKVHVIDTQTDEKTGKEDNKDSGDSKEDKAKDESKQNPGAAQPLRPSPAPVPAQGNQQPLIRSF